jgi:4'-phosphopantetheinyl transferase
MSAEVTVRWGRLDRHDADRFEPLLSSDERARADSFRFARDRSRYVVARGLLRTLLGEQLGIDPERIDFGYGEHGKPCLAGRTRLRFNLAHSKDVVAVALCEGREIGIDVEAQREGLFAEEIARRYLPERAAMEIERRPEADRAREFFRAWVRQEAYAKGLGAGLELIGQSPDPEDWTIVDLELTPGYAAALAIEGGGALDGGEQLVTHPARVDHSGVELDQVVDVLHAGPAEPVR